MRFLISLISSIFLVLTFIPIVNSTDFSCIRTIYVDDDNVDGPWDGTQENPYQHIQDAIDNASDGDTIFVFRGTYSSISVFGKNLTLMGEDKKDTIIDAHTYFACRFHITSSEIHNFTLQHGDVAGFELWGGRSNIISDNIITSNGIGIYIYDSRHNVIKNNIITDNKENGIYFSMVTSTVIEHNKISNTTEGTGLRIAYSNDVIIRNNNIHNNKIGLAMVECLVSPYPFPFQDRIADNNFFDNTIHAGVEDRYRAYGSSFLCVIFFHNYWGSPRMSPKLIWTLESEENPISFPCNIDLFPASTPIHTLLKNEDGDGD